MSETPPIDPFTPAIHLIYAPPSLAVPTDDVLTESLTLSDPGLDPQGIHITRSMDSTERFLGELRFGDHLIRIAGLPNPLPQEIVNRTIHVSPWQPQIRSAMRQHRSHLSLVYAGESPSPTAQMIALYQAAAALRNENMLGIVNENAWTAHPPADFLDPDHLASYKDQLPFILWIGYVKFYLDRERYWLVTKGHHVFDVPDLASLVTDAAEEENTINRFTKIFYYIYENDVAVVAGDSLELASTTEKLALGEVTEHPEWLMGPSGTLVVSPLEEEE
ncbi:hypothetical protein KQH62_04835 [bacterium]|nr:hypothetical protein [bacterium]